MLHTVIVHDPALFRIIVKQNEARSVPLPNAAYETYSYGNTRIIGAYDTAPREVLTSIMQELNPDTVFFLAEAYPVSDEKFSGDIVLPNVFFLHKPAGEKEEGHIPDQTLSHPLFLEHYPLQGDYDFESFGLSVGGIHVSGEWQSDVEDFRIGLRLAYENDTFDPVVYDFVESAQQQDVQERIYPVVYIGSDDREGLARNLWSIVRFVIGSIDQESVSAEEHEEGQVDEGDYGDEEE